MCAGSVRLFVCGSGAYRISVKINGPIKKVNKLFAQNDILTTHTHRSPGCRTRRTEWADTVTARASCTKH